MNLCPTSRWLIAFGVALVAGSLIINPHIWSAPPALVINGAAK